MEILLDKIYLIKLKENKLIMKIILLINNNKKQLKNINIFQIIHNNINIKLFNQNKLYNNLLVNMMNNNKKI